MDREQDFELRIPLHKNAAQIWFRVVRGAGQRPQHRDWRITRQQGAATRAKPGSRNNREQAIRQRARKERQQADYHENN